MTLSVKSSRTDASLKLELADRLAGQATGPKRSLEAVFKGAIQKLEEIAGKKFDAPLKERVWNKVSKKQLETLKVYLLMEYSKIILKDFSKAEVEKMLEEHKRTGSIDLTYSAQIQVACHLYRSVISDSVADKAMSMTKDWIPEIVKALTEEGIKLPEPRKKAI